MALAVLANPLLPQLALLDAIQFAETGHLSPQDALTAVSPKGAQGPYQFLQKNLHDMGYGMPKNISLADVQNRDKARNLADRYVTGFSESKNFTTPLQKLVAYNLGPTAAERWLASGGRIADLPSETQRYIQRAAGFLTKTATEPQQQGNQVMAITPAFAMDDISGDLALYDPQHEAELIAQRQQLMAMQTPMDQRMAAPEPALMPSPNTAALSQPMIEDRVPIAVAPAIPQSDPIGQTRQVAQPVSQNRRDLTSMSMVSPPPQRIGMNEMLIRMGAAGLGASQRGGLEALQAIGDTYGAIQDANRATGLAAYEAQMDALSNGKDTKADGEAKQQIGQIDQTLFDMNRAVRLLEEGGVTGPFDAYVADIYDRAAGNEDRASRLLLQKLRVDDAMLRVAQTKGAISNKEMELFLAPAPSLSDQEDVWIAWISSRQEALRNIRSRLASGLGVTEPASAAQVDQFTRGAGSPNMSEADSIVGL